MAKTFRHLVGSLLLLPTLSLRPTTITTSPHLLLSTTTTCSSRTRKFSTAAKLFGSAASYSNNNINMKFIYAIDFDGVLVDSATELCLSGYDAAKILFPGAPWLTRRLRRPDQLQELVNKFRQVRPCVEFGWEAPILLKLLTEENLSVDQILNDFQQGLRERAMKELLGGVTEEECKDALKKARNDWIDSDVNGQDWLEAHGFYEGACDAVRNFLEQPDKRQDVYIITTKAADFTQRLLEKQRLTGKDAPGGGIPDERIFGLGSPPKEKVLAILLNKRGEEYRAVFVEDRLLTLDRTMSDEKINQRVVPVVASWGYNTPEQREVGTKAGYVVLPKNEPRTLGNVLNDEVAAFYCRNFY